MKIKTCILVKLVGFLYEEMAGGFYKGVRNGKLRERTRLFMTTGNTISFSSELRRLGNVFTVEQYCETDDITDNFII